MRTEKGGGDRDNQGLNFWGVSVGSCLDIEGNEKIGGMAIGKRDI